MPDKSQSSPLHVQVSNYLREKIYNGEWTPGDRIPTELKLCDMLNMSRGSIKKGISTLIDEGLLAQYRGKGTYVTSQGDISHPTGSMLMSFAESLRLQHINFVTEVLGKEVIPADGFLSKKLYMDIGDPVFFLRRVRYTDGVPIMYIENRINMLPVPGIEDVDFAEETLFSTIGKLSGKTIGFSRAKYAAKVAGEKRGRILRVSEESPVLHLEQHIFYSDDTPVEWGNVWLQANKYVVGTLLMRSSS